MVKLSADRESPHYYAKTYPDGVRIFVDGAEVDHPTECDTDEGWVEHDVLDGKGHVQEDPEKPGFALMARKYGVVTFDPIAREPVEMITIPKKELARLYKLAFDAGEHIVTAESHNGGLVSVAMLKQANDLRLELSKWKVILQ